ncbi:MAG: hypothetical protein ACRC10_01315 [Thermoguttaceae bacterium]
MSIQEIGGSPKEQYDLDRFQAQREFLVPWEKRESFVKTVLGTAKTPTQGTALSYPGQIQANAVRLKLEPFAPETINVSALNNLATDLPNYEGALLKATVYYQSTETSRRDLPLVEVGSLSYRMVMNSQELEIDLSNWKWDDLLIIVQPLFATKRTPITEHHLVWKKVVAPPWSVIHKLHGKVNRYEFLGCEPETLLFDGGEGYKLYAPESTPDQEPASFTWELKYIFRECSIKFANRIYGWNHLYRAIPGGWEKAKLSGSYMYDTADFNTLFQPGS